MNIRENIMAVFHRETPTRIPWLTYDIPYPMLPRGTWERKLRNKGLGITNECAVFTTETPNVQVEQKTTVEGTRRVLVTTYHTPVGSVTEKMDMTITPPNPWIIEHMIKDISDYEVVKFIIEDTVYEPNYESFLWWDRHIGNDGFISTGVGGTPFQQLLIRYMGYHKCIVELYKHPEEFNELIKVMGKKYEERCRLVADSPAEVVTIEGNLDARVTNPKLFEKFVLPYHKIAAQILHPRGKILMAHYDGAVAALKDLIPQTGVDVVEALTPPPMGDLPLSEARACWGKKLIISANFPESVCHFGMQAVKKYAMEILKTVAPGDGFILSVTEDIPHRKPYDVLEQTLRTITEVMWKYGKYPIKI
jgi:hypothetical protein